LPKQVALRRGEVGCRDAGLARVRRLAAGVGQNVGKRRFREAGARLQRRWQVADQAPRQRFLRAQRIEARVRT
jgi:hypothetical protein